MADQHHNSVEETTSSTTFPITLAGATTGNKTFGSALSDGQTCSIAVEDESGNWDVRVGCTYTAAGGTLSAGTVKTSNGTPISTVGAKTITMIQEASNIVTPDNTKTLTNKTIDADDNTIQDVTSSVLKTTGLVTGTIPIAFATASHNTSTTYTKGAEFKVRRGGTINTYMRVRGDNNSKANQTGYARIYKNGVATGTIRSSTDETWTAWFSEDITVSAGDLIQVYVRVSDTVASSAKAQCFLRTDGVHFAESSVDAMAYDPHHSSLDES